MSLVRRHNSRSVKPFTLGHQQNTTRDYDWQNPRTHCAEQQQLCATQLTAQCLCLQTVCNDCCRVRSAGQDAVDMNLQMLAHIPIFLLDTTTHSL